MFKFATRGCHHHPCRGTPWLFLRVQGCAACGPVRTTPEDHLTPRTMWRSSHRRVSASSTCCVMATGLEPVRVSPSRPGFATAGRCVYPIPPYHHNSMPKNDESREQVAAVSRLRRLLVGSPCQPRSWYETSCNDVRCQSKGMESDPRNAPMKNAVKRFQQVDVHWATTYQLGQAGMKLLRSVDSAPSATGDQPP